METISECGCVPLNDFGGMGGRYKSGIAINSLLGVEEVDECFTQG